MDDRPTAVVRCPPCRQQSASSTSVNGSTGSWPSPPPLPAPQDASNFLCRRARAGCPSETTRACRLLSEGGRGRRGASKCGLSRASAAECRDRAVSRREEAKSDSDELKTEDQPRRYPAERDVVRAALAHRAPDDSFPFPIVQELVRPGVLVQNESDSSCDLSDDAFHDAADGLAEEFRDGSGSSETSNEEKNAAAAATTDVICTVAAATPADAPSAAAMPTPDSVSSPSSSSTQETSPSRPRSSRFAKHRFAEAPPRKMTPRAPELPSPEHPPSDESSSSSSETLSPFADAQPPPPATPPKRDSAADSDDEDGGRGVLVRSTSLKSGKSPPGTPFKKKIVRFADALGLDLAAVRTIVSEELPMVPASAFSHLQLAPVVRSPPPCTLELKALFAQPGASPTFLSRLTSQRVCLESVVSSGCALHAVIRVLNVAFEKLVVLRYSLDNWRSFCDLRAVYLPGSSDGISDRFGVDVYLTPQGDAQVQMCVRYVVGEQEFWDNNEGANYCFEFRDSPKDEPEVTPLMNYL
ncbi:hypothetical protein V5799_015835 [Amblyomma americanum]|uniref:CBM21 domain-containing protein n=1 Tax=Amblyomma americanum TaxID=6943 RepID=A0AAQ4F6P8_AMBAM